MAHVILTVSQYGKARAFYSALLPEFGMEKVLDHDDFCYHVGARTAIGVRKCDTESEGEIFRQSRVGLHHICLRARSREDIERTADLVHRIGGKVVRGPVEGDWAPGYDYVLFEDPADQKSSGAFSMTSFRTKKLRNCLTLGSVSSRSRCRRLKSEMSRALTLMK